MSTPFEEERAPNCECTHRVTCRACVISVLGIFLTMINWTAIASWGLILIGLYYFWTWAFESCTKGIAS